MYLLCETIQTLPEVGLVVEHPPVEWNCKLQGTFRSGVSVLTSTHIPVMMALYSLLFYEATYICVTEKAGGGPEPLASISEVTGLYFSGTIPGTDRFIGPVKSSFFSGKLQQ